MVPEPCSVAPAASELSSVPPASIPTGAPTRSEPPASVHLSAGAHHADGHAGFHEHHGDHDAGEVHNDLDVPLADSPLAKPGKLVQDLPLFLLAAVALFAFLGSPRQRPRFREPPALLPWALLHLLPPLRGPPADGRGRQRASA